jgi:hypothetical protein
MSVELLFLVVCAGLVATWWWAVQGRELVDAVVRRVCDDLALQRLDETVALERIGFTRDDGRLAIRRLYAFEFSHNGADRRRGHVCLVNAIAHWVHLEHPDGPIHIDLA